MSEAPKRHRLNDFADRWKLDGDLIRCRCCNRAQEISWMLHGFPHRAYCRNETAERNPWLTLGSLITAQLSRAKQPDAPRDAGPEVGR